MVPEYQMSGGVGPDVLEDVTISEMVEGTMVMVKPASMLFGGGASRRSVGVFRLVSRLFLESVYHGSSLFPLCVFGFSVSSGSAICAQCYA
jgi:hypothetical protein